MRTPICVVKETQPTAAAAVTIMWMQRRRRVMITLAATPPPESWTFTTRQAADVVWFHSGVSLYHCAPLSLDSLFLLLFCLVRYDICHLSFFSYLVIIFFLQAARPFLL
jgi:hypothetical protein